MDYRLEYEHCGKEKVLKIRKQKWRCEKKTEMVFGDAHSTKKSSLVEDIPYFACWKALEI